MTSLVGKFINVWLHPWSSMKAVKDEGQDAPIKSSIIFIVVMAIISGLITAIMGTIFPPPAAAAGPAGLQWLAIVVVPLISFVGSFLGAGIIWGLTFGFLKGSLNEYKTSYRLLALLAAFSPISAILSPIPTAGFWIGLLINAWATIVMVGGIIIVASTSKVRTIVICALIFGPLFLLGIVARFAAESQLAAGGFPGLEAPAGDLGLDDEALNRELEALAEEARENQ